jgi:hypothetical protein
MDLEFLDEPARSDPELRSLLADLEYVRRHNPSATNLRAGLLTDIIERLAHLRKDMTEPDEENR